MKCPNCSSKLFTIATREAEEKVYRVKKCKECEYRAHSLEMVIPDMPIPTQERKKK